MAGIPGVYIVRAAPTLYAHIGDGDAGNRMNLHQTITVPFMPMGITLELETVHCRSTEELPFTG